MERHTGHLAGVIEVLLKSHPGQDTARFLADLVYLFCRSALYDAPIEVVMEFIVACGFDSQITAWLACWLSTITAADRFAEENDLDAEDRDILLVLLGLKKG